MIYAMEYYGNNDYRDYLEHYGVKGMKWGKHLFGEQFLSTVNAARTGLSNASSRYSSAKRKANIVKGIPRLLKNKAESQSHKSWDYRRSSIQAERKRSEYHNKAFAARSNAENEQKKYSPGSYGRTDYSTMTKVNQYRSDAGKYQKEANEKLRKKITGNWLSKVSGTYSKALEKKARPASVRSAGADYSLTNKVLPSLKSKKSKWENANKKLNETVNKIETTGQKYEGALNKAHKSLTSGRKNEQPRTSVVSKVRSAITSLPGKIKSVPQKIISAGKAIVDRIVNFFAKRFKKKNS